MQGDSRERAVGAAGLTKRVTRFADIPSLGQPEGISVSPNGQVAVGTFNPVGQSHVFVFDALDFRGIAKPETFIAA